MARWQRAWEALERGDQDPVRRLSEQDRRILKAALALKLRRPDEALAVLSDASRDDPLAALIEAEAHRQEALEAVGKAGDYAKVIGDADALLARADLSKGLGEAEARLQLLLDQIDRVQGLPVDLLMPGPGVANVFFVDKARSRLFVFEPDAEGNWRKVADEYVVTGSRPGDKEAEGDGRTPNGVYRFVSRLSGPSLAPRYGPVAFPIDYPNALDRLHGKNGHGIWLHGYPVDKKRRPPRDTRGCFSVPNDRLLALADRIRLGRSWVVVGRDFVFDREPEREALRRQVLDAIEGWRRDWSSLDTEAYLKHYHPKFRSGRMDLAAWARYKRRVNASKRFIEVKLEDLTLIHDPNRWPEGEVVVAEFTQHYRSSNYADTTRKRLYLVRASRDEPWRILIEESLGS